MENQIEKNDEQFYYYTYTHTLRVDKNKNKEYLKNYVETNREKIRKYNNERQKIRRAEDPDFVEKQRKAAYEHYLKVRDTPEYKEKTKQKYIRKKQKIEGQKQKENAVLYTPV